MPVEQVHPQTPSEWNEEPSMKKIIITILTIISISTLIFVNNYKVNNKINDIPKEENNKSNLISMMLETDYGTG